MTIIKDGNGVLIRDTVIIIGYYSGCYKKKRKGDVVIKGDNYHQLGCGIDLFNEYLKRC